MSLEDREIRWINPFDPIIVETTISDKLHDILLTRADQIRNGNHPNPAITKDTNDYRDRLAGNLSEEYYINVNIKYYDINNSIYITRFYD